MAILDIDMPVMNGIDAAIAIRAALSPAPLLVAVTGNPSNVVTLRDLKIFDWVLQKPVSAEQLLRFLPQAA